MDNAANGVIKRSSRDSLSPDLAVHCIWYMFVYLVCFAFYYLIGCLRNAHSSGQSQGFHTSVLEVGLSYHLPQEPGSAQTESNPAQKSPDRVELH